MSVLEASAGIIWTLRSDEYIYIYIYILYLVFHVTVWSKYYTPSDPAKSCVFLYSFFSNGKVIFCTDFYGSKIVVHNFHRGSNAKWTTERHWNNISTYFTYCLYHTKCVVDITCTVETLYNTINFCWSTHKRHSLARPKGRGMGCLLWVQRATYCVDLSILSSIKICYNESCYKGSPLYIWFSNR